MKRSSILLIALLTVLTGCTNSEIDELQKEVAAKERQIQELVKVKSEQETELFNLRALLQTIKEPITLPQPDPGVIAGAGDGRFVIVPSRVRPGDLIAIYNDLPNGTVRIARMSTTTELLRQPGPEARNFVLITIPPTTEPGEYSVVLSGPGGWVGQGTILVEAPSE